MILAIFDAGMDTVWELKSKKSPSTWHYRRHGVNFFSLQAFVPNIVAIALRRAIPDTIISNRRPSPIKI
jgi:hypothetical protein